MRGVTVLLVVVVATFLFLDVEGNCVVGGETLPVGEHIRNCKRYTCDKSGGISVLGCPAYACKEQIGYKEDDPSKPYPECCGGPICKE